MKTLVSIVIKATSLILFLFYFSCSDKNRIENIESFNIMSVLIDNLAKPIIPPPEPNLSDIEFKNKSDSLYKTVTDNEFHEKEFVIYIDTIKKIRSIDLNNSKYSNLIQKLVKLEQFENIDPAKIKTIKNIKVHQYKVSSPNNIDWNETDMVISFSKVAFNSNYTEASIVVGVTRGRLNGYSFLAILKKSENGWGIISKITLSIS